MTLQQIGGAAVMLLFLADIFLTVLYARAGTGLLAPRWNRLVWAFFKALSAPFGRRRGSVLSFAGPLIVILLVLFWSLGLTVGAALIIQPELGSAIRPSSGNSPRDFVTALLAAGNSLSIVGGGDYSPHTNGTRLLYLFNSLVGASVLSLILSYLVQVYSGLRTRNSLAFSVDLLTGGTGNAAEMLARLGPDGDFSNGTSELGNLVEPLASVKEAHHFYPLLFYFRFDDPLYSMSRLTFVLLDLTTLIETTLDRQGNATLVRSAPVLALGRGARMLLETLDRYFPTAGGGGTDAVDPRRIEESYAAAVATLQRAGIEVRPNARAYADQRSRWEPLVRRVAPVLGYPVDEIDPRRSGDAAAPDPSVHAGDRPPLHAPQPRAAGTARG
jgi:hypothetical protein